MAMDRVKFIAEVNLGQLITMGTMLVAIGVGWGSITSVQNSQASELTNVRTAVSALELDRLSNEARLTRIETLIQGQDSKLDRVIAALTD